MFTQEQIIAELSFDGMFADIKICDGQSIEFRAKHNIHKNRYDEVYSIIEKDGKLLLTDKGNTLTILADIFELSKPNIVKNIDTLLAQYNMRKTGNEIVYVLFSDISIVTQIMRYLQGINFLFAMKIFYV